MNAMRFALETTPEVITPRQLGHTPLRIPDMEWTELHTTLNLALKMIGETPRACSRSSLNMVCRQLRDALNIAIRLGGEDGWSN